MWEPDADKEWDRLYKIEAAAKAVFVTLAQSNTYSKEYNEAWTMLGEALNVLHSDEIEK